MFARILEITPKLEKKEEFLRVVKKDVLPLLRKQHGFLEILPFLPEVKNEKIIAISLWTERKHAERYQHEVLPKVEEIVKPYLAAPFVVRDYMVETTLCEHFEKALVA
jgi:quinol monooxygenase YgiN